MVSGGVHGDGDQAAEGLPGDAFRCPDKSVNFSFILCYDISRFGRLDNDEAGYWRHEFRKHGVEVVYAVENLQGDDTDDLIVSTKQWLAREYSRKIGEYVCRNIISRSGDARERARAFNIGGWRRSATTPLPRQGRQAGTASCG